MTALPDWMRPPRAEGWFAEEAGIPHYWCIEDEDGAPVVHVYELDEPTGAYAPAGIFRGTLQRPVPFEVSLDLDKLTPPRSI
ncbi:hypothetical protein AB0B93_07035 [Streptomyces lavendulae]|nr:hypothetical protein [Streptomyces lavendulae]